MFPFLGYSTRAHQSKSQWSPGRNRETSPKQTHIHANTYHANLKPVQRTAQSTKPSLLPSLLLLGLTKKKKKKKKKKNTGASTGRNWRPIDQSLYLSYWDYYINLYMACGCPRISGIERWIASLIRWGFTHRVQQIQVYSSIIVGW